jgi:hypothetical protein
MRRPARGKKGMRARTPSGSETARSARRPALAYATKARTRVRRQKTTATSTMNAGSPRRLLMDPSIPLLHGRGKWCWKTGWEAIECGLHNKATMVDTGAMMKKLLVSLMAAFCLVLASCGSPGTPDDNNDNDDNDDDDTPPVVSPFLEKTWVVGQDADGEPAVWNNDVTTKLSVPTDATGAAYCVALSGDVVYAAGYYHDGTSYYPCVWADGTRKNLEAWGAQWPGMVKAIAVSGTTVYAAGEAWDEGNLAYVAGYWTYDGSAWTWTPLTTVTGIVNAITIDGSGLPLFAGETDVDGTTTACWWDTTPSENLCFLPYNATSSSVYGMAWNSGTESYLVGYYAVAPDSYPCFWTNAGTGTRAELSYPATPDRVNAVAISGSDIYMSGWCTISGTTTPGYWKGIQWHACKIDGPGFNFATAMALSGTTACIAGQYLPSGAAQEIGCFWAGDERIDVEGILPVNGIAVKD